MFWGAEKKAEHTPFPASSRHRFPGPGRASTPAQAALQRAPLSRAHSLPPARPLGGRAAPGLTADHPAADGFVAAEQRGAQQQPDHAAHCGAAAAAGVLRGAKAVSAHRAAGALTPAPPCLPAGPTPAAQAQPPGPLHASPLAGLGAWRAAAARGCAGLERTTRRMHFQGEGTEVRWPRVCLSQRRSSSPRLDLTGPLCTSPRPLANKRAEPARPGRGSHHSSSGGFTLEAPSYIPTSQGSGPLLVIIFNYFVSPALQSMPAPPLKTGATLKMVQSAAPPPALRSSRAPLSIR